MTVVEKGPGRVRLLGSKKKYKVHSQRVGTYLKGRGFEFVAEAGLAFYMRAPGKWSGEKTDFIVRRAMENKDVGVPFASQIDIMENLSGVLSQMDWERENPGVQASIDTTTKELRVRK